MAKRAGSACFAHAALERASKTESARLERVTVVTIARTSDVSLSWRGAGSADPERRPAETREQVITA
jgi:hypothetical protein